MIRVEPCLVHAGIDDGDTYELMFVDDDGATASAVTIHPDGTMSLQRDD